MSSEQIFATQKDWKLAPLHGGALWLGHLMVVAIVLGTSALIATAQEKPKLNKTAVVANIRNCEHAPTEESLKEVFEIWQTHRLSENSEIRVAALEALAPTADDLTKVFSVNQELVARCCVALNRMAANRIETITLNELRSCVPSIP